MKKSALAILALIVLLTVAGVLLMLFRSTPPLVTLTPPSGAVSGRQAISLVVKAPSGLKEMTVTAVQGALNRQLAAKQYPKGAHEARESFILGGVGLKEGPFTIVIRTTDRSFARFGAGKSVLTSRQFAYDNKPPSIAILTAQHNITRGGSGLVVYSLNKEVQRTGIVFADRFFPGYRQKNGNYACLFAYPYDVPEEQFIPKVLAVDRAGNERRTGIYFHLLPKRFPSDRIELTDNFLEKVAAEFRDKYPQGMTPLDIFLKVNRDERQQDLKVLRECGLKTSPAPVWSDGFIRLPNAAPRGSFAQDRTYLYKGKPVDRQTHLGVDLASLPHSPVPAANAGKVVYADDLGIYGQCVIIDHGLGLQSLYGHLSQIGVKAGDSIEKGAVIGKTGDTGLAGGDHLHFGVVVSGEQVNPIEWWDEHWIRNNVTGKLSEQGQ